jgi:pantothenate kinase
MLTPLLVLEHPVQHLLSRLERRSARWIIGIAGLPGSGKSTLANRLAAEVNARIAPDTVVALGMDGFHLTKLELSQMPDPAAALRRRGAPWTFDTGTFLERLHLLRSGWNQVPVLWPDFQHEVGDPVEGALTVLPTTRIILVEGLYLLHNEDGWEEIRRTFDERWFLDTPWNVAMERLTQRHMQAWGLTPDEAKNRIAANDALNANIVMESRKFAEWVLG